MVGNKSNYVCFGISQALTAVTIEKKTFNLFFIISVHAKGFVSLGNIFGTIILGKTFQFIYVDYIRTILEVTNSDQIRVIYCQNLL